MKTHLALAGILALLAACSHEGSSPSSSGDAGTGLNTIDRKYPKPAPAVQSAAVSAFMDMGITVDKDTHDNMGGQVTGHRADGSKAMVKVSAIDKSNCNVSVRVDPGDARKATMIQDKITEKLGMEPHAK